MGNEFPPGQFLPCSVAQNGCCRGNFSSKVLDDFARAVGLDEVDGCAKQNKRSDERCVEGLPDDARNDRRNQQDDCQWICKQNEKVQPRRPATALCQLSCRFFSFDPTFSPPGKTAVTCFLPTRNYQYWLDLDKNDQRRYEAEKQRLAEGVVHLLDKRIPGVRSAIEVVDVCTPATVIRSTGNWQGSMEGWLPTPDVGFAQLPEKLPGLANFLMVGQWVEPGGGLPSGLLTSRAAVRAVCRADERDFLPAGNGIN